MKRLTTKLKGAAVAALVAFSLPSLAATPTITGVTAQQRYPWNGKFDISYTASGVDAACQAQSQNASLKVFAVEQTTHVTNVAENAYLSGDTTMADGTHSFVWDMDAQGIFKGLVSTNFEVFVSAEATAQEKSLGGVQLWENGPYWAECNVGATKPEECGYYFMWGDTNAYIRNANNDGWVSAKDGVTLSGGFTRANCPSDYKNDAALRRNGFVDSTDNLVATHDAATAHFGEPWRLPTTNEVQALYELCETSWITMNGVSGRLMTGRGTYASKSIFLPAAGDGSGLNLNFLGTHGGFWTSKPMSELSYNALSYRASAFSFGSRSYAWVWQERYYGNPVRPVRVGAK